MKVKLLTLSVSVGETEEIIIQTESVASLPQGWHGVLPVPKKSNFIQPPKISYSQNQTILPALGTYIKKTKMSQIKPPIPLPNGTVNKSARANVTQTLRSNSTSIPLQVKRKKTEDVELANIKKELSRVKDENSVLRCRVRKIDDDNAKKAREIERLRLTVKDLSDKKKEPLSSNLPANSRFLLNKQKSEASKIMQNGNSKTSWKENTLHSEIIKLKDIINKLQEENKKTTTQLKEKDQEIKNLRHQLAKVPGRNIPNKLTNNQNTEVSRMKLIPKVNTAQNVNSQATASNRKIARMVPKNSKPVLTRTKNNKPDQGVQNGQEPVTVAVSVLKTESNSGKQI